MFSKKILKISSGIIFSNICCGVGNSFAAGGSFFYFKGKFKEAVKVFGEVFKFEKGEFPHDSEKNLPISEKLFKESKEKLFSCCDVFGAKTIEEEIDEFSKSCENVEDKFKRTHTVLVGDCAESGFNLRSGFAGEEVNLKTFSENFKCDIKGKVSEAKKYFCENKNKIAKDFCKEYIRFVIDCFKNGKDIDIKKKDVFKIVDSNFDTICEYLKEDKPGAVLNLLDEKLKLYVGDFSVKKNPEYEKFCKGIFEKYYEALLWNSKVYEFYLCFYLSVVKNTKDIIFPVCWDGLSKIVSDVSSPFERLYGFFEMLPSKLPQNIRLGDLRDGIDFYSNKIFSTWNELNKHNAKGVGNCNCEDANKYKNIFAFYVHARKYMVVFFREIADCVGLKKRTRTLLKDAEEFAKKIAMILGLKEPTALELDKVKEIDDEKFEKLRELSSNLLKRGDSFALPGGGGSFVDNSFHLFSFNDESFEEAVEEFCKVFIFGEDEFPHDLEKDLSISEELFKKDKGKLFSYSDYRGAKIDGEKADEFSKLYEKIEDEYKGILWYLEDKELAGIELRCLAESFQVCVRAKVLEVKERFSSNKEEIARDFCREYLCSIGDYVPNDDSQNKINIGIGIKDATKIVKDNFDTIRGYFMTDKLDKVIDLLNEKLKDYIGDFSVEGNTKYVDFCKKLSDKYYNLLFLNSKVYEFYLRFFLSVVKNTRNIVIPRALAVGWESRFGKICDVKRDRFCKIRDEIFSSFEELYDFFEKLIPKLWSCGLFNFSQEILYCCEEMDSMVTGELTEHSIQGADDCKCNEVKYERIFSLPVSKKVGDKVDLCYFKEISYCKGPEEKARRLLKNVQDFAKKIATALGLKEPTVLELDKVEEIDGEKLENLRVLSNSLPSRSSSGPDPNLSVYVKTTYKEIH